MRFKQNTDRDATLVYAGMTGGFEAVCSQAMLMPEFSNGPNDVIKHSKWLKEQTAEYIESVIQKVQKLEEGNI